jgi:hypothetical protein
MTRSVLLLALLAAGSVFACAASQAAAARDPMRCERDPSCAKTRGAYPDCSKQCADDPECMDRCREVQSGTDTFGHP